jgi:aminopeptidase
LGKSRWCRINRRFRNPASCSTTRCSIENAASHIALGTAYRFTLDGGDDDDAFVAAGGNVSATHVDLMIGSADLDIDGVTQTGAAEPVMRAGEWAF